MLAIPYTVFWVIRTKDGTSFKIDPKVETNLESNEKKTFNDEFENLSRLYFEFFQKIRESEEFYSNYGSIIKETDALLQYNN